MAQQELKRQIGLFDAVMLISGDMIGIGIFVSTGGHRRKFPTPGGVLLVWIFGGLLALAGALSCAELSASLALRGRRLHLHPGSLRQVGGLSFRLVVVSGDVFGCHRVSRRDFNGFMSFFFPCWESKMCFFHLRYPCFPINVTMGTLFSMFAVLLISRAALFRRAAGNGNAKYFDGIKIGSLLGNNLLGIFVRQRRHEPFQSLFRLGKDRQF